MLRCCKHACSTGNIFVLLLLLFFTQIPPSTVTLPFVIIFTSLALMVARTHNFSFHSLFVLVAGKNREKENTLKKNHWTRVWNLFIYSLFRCCLSRSLGWKKKQMCVKNDAHVISVSIFLFIYIHSTHTTPFIVCLNQNARKFFNLCFVFHAFWRFCLFGRKCVLHELQPTHWTWTHVRLEDLIFAIGMRNT